MEEDPEPFPVEEELLLVVPSVSPLPLLLQAQNAARQRIVAMIMARIFVIFILNTFLILKSINHYIIKHWRTKIKYILKIFLCFCRVIDTGC